MWDHNENACAVSPAPDMIFVSTGKGARDLGLARGAGLGYNRVGLTTTASPLGGLAVAKHEWMERISVDPRIHGGEPCVKGTRIPASVVVGSIADGDDFETLIKAYPALTPEDIRACLKYAAEALRDSPLLPLGG